MDPNFQEEFVNAQSSFLSFMRQQEQLQEQTQILSTDNRHREVTLKALDEAPDSQLFKNAGKIYFEMDTEQIKKHMAEENEKAEKELKLISSTLEYVNKKVKESEDKVRDMIKIAQQSQK